jgi:hypothetical protein
MLPLCSSLQDDNTLDQWLYDCSQFFCSMPSSQADTALLYIFIIHALVLDVIPVEDRARSNEVLNSELVTHMSQYFLPMIFYASECATSSTHIVPQVDGRVLASLIKCLITSCDGTHLDIIKVIGATTYQHASRIWSSLRLPEPTPVLITFANRFPSPQFQPDVIAVTRPLQLLSFSNNVFDDELPTIDAATESSSGDGFELSTAKSHLQFGRGLTTAFSDTQHWHDTKKAILPRYQGGEDPKPVIGFLRQKALKRAQRFMSTLRRHAETLTGAHGGNLDQIVIPAVSPRGHNQSKEHRASEVRPQESPCLCSSILTSLHLEQNVSGSKAEIWTPFVSGQTT